METIFKMIYLLHYKIIKVDIVQLSFGYQYKVLRYCSCKYYLSEVFKLLTLITSKQVSHQIKVLTYHA